MNEVSKIAFEKTRNILYLLKVVDLVNTLLKVQDPESDNYPTYLASNLHDQEGWINCMLYTTVIIRNLDDFLKSINPDNKVLLPENNLD